MQNDSRHTQSLKQSGRRLYEPFWRRCRRETQSSECAPAGDNRIVEIIITFSLICLRLLIIPVKKKNTEEQTKRFRDVANKWLFVQTVRATKSL